MQLAAFHPVIRVPWSSAFFVTDYTSRNPNENPGEGFEFVVVPLGNFAAVVPTFSQQFHGFEGRHTNYKHVPMFASVIGGVRKVKVC